MDGVNRHNPSRVLWRIDRSMVVSKVAGSKGMACPTWKAVLSRLDELCERSKEEN